MAEISCPICGGKQFKDGILKGKMDVRLVTDDDNWMTKNTVFGGDEIKVKICQGCKYLMLFG